jgi:DNA-binding winged helix-turn-helix (wHTH) protein/Tol biopolymer transport system component
MRSALSEPGIVSFDEFEAHLRTRELLRRGSRVRLPDQSFALLAVLLECPGELVAREEIAKRLWPGDTFVDFDHGLNNAVNRLREALGDSADAPRFIETLPRRGYRFIAKTNGSGSVEAAGTSKIPNAGTTFVGNSTDANLEGSVGQPGRRSYRWMIRTIPAIAALAVVLAIQLVRTTHPPSRRTFVLPPEGSTFNLVGDSGGSVALSADGRKLAFVAVDAKARSRIWVRELSKLNADPIEGTEGASFPFWSPDGRWLGFFADGKLKKINPEEGPAITLCDSTFGRGWSWSRSGVIIFAPASHGGIFRIPDSGGVPVAVTKVDTSIHTTHRWPKFLPDGEHFIYLAANHFSDASHNGIYRSSLDDQKTEFLVATDADATYESGYLFYLRKDDLLAQRFDASRGRLEGEPRPTVERVLYDPTIWKAVFDASNNGLMAYQLGVKSIGTQLKWFDRAGKEIGVLGDPGFYWNPRLSRDGRKLAFGRAKPSAGYSDVWVYDIVSGIKSRITLDEFDYGYPLLIQNDTQVIFDGKRQHYNLYVSDSTGSQKPRLVLDIGIDSWPVDISPDGRFLIFAQGNAIGQGKSQLRVYAMNGKTAPYRLLEGDAVERGAVFSPDGRWVAYSSTQSGREDVYVIAFHARPDPGDGVDPSVGRRWQISSSGGYNPRWSRGGRELIYVNEENTLIAVSVSGKAQEFEVGEAHALFHANPLIDRYLLNFDTSPDGNKILVNVSTPERAAPITIVENWPSDFN